jgi:O-antigen ligase
MAAELFRDAGSRRRFAGIFLATFLLVVIDCSIQYAFGKDLLRGFAAEYSRSGIRLIGPFGNFAKMATYLILVIPVFGMQFWDALSRRPSGRHFLYALALTGAGLLLLYLTRCRGAIIALGLVVLVFFIYRRWFKVLGALLLLCLALIAVIPRNVLIHPDTLGKEQSLFERIELWKRATDVIAAKPWTGTGINTYNVAHEKYDLRKQKKLMPISGTSIVIRQNQDGSVSFDTGSAVWTSDTEQKTIRVGGIAYNIYKDPAGQYFIWNDIVARGYYVHNGYLQLAAEVGLPGVFFFLLFIFMFLKRSFRSVRRVRGSPEENERFGILAGLLAFLIYAAADNNLQSPPSLMFFWFSAGVLMALQGSDPEVKTI